MTHGHYIVSLRAPPEREREASLRCYVPRLSTIAAVLVVGILALRPTAGRASAGLGLVTDIIILVGGCLFAAVLTVVGVAMTKQRRAAAGACHTCSHPCRQQALLPRGRPSPRTPLADAPGWPHRPLTRAALPVIVIPRQSLPIEEEMIRSPAVGTADR